MLNGTLDQTRTDNTMFLKHLSLPIGVREYIKAAIYTGEGRQILGVLTFVVVLVYCVSLNDEAPYRSKG